MVRVLIALRRAITVHQWDRAAKVPLLLALGFGVLAAASTFALGFVRPHVPGADNDVLATVFVLWIGGQLAQAALNGGDTTLRPELFALLPLRARRLALSLLVIGLLDPVLVLVTVAYAALIPLGLRHGVAAGGVAIVVTVLLSVLTAVLATVVGGLLGPGARRSRDLGTVVTAIAIAVLALAGTFAPSVIDALEHGRAGTLHAVVRALPSSWGANAVQAAADHRDGIAAAWCAALAVLIVAISAVWPAVLQRRMTIRGTGRRGPTKGRRGRILPATPGGAVTAKELRLWARDPIRLTCLLIALVVGVGVALIPRVTAHTSLLMPFAGPLTVLIAGACACNLYGNDGTSVWLTVATPAAEGADVRGRVSAWLIVVTPITLIETVALSALAGRPQLWPWSLGLFLALLGCAAGLVPLASLTSVVPLDDAGNPSPAWSLKVHIMLVVLAATALPALVLLVTGAETGTTWLGWTALPVAALTAVLVGVAGLRTATGRLRERQVDLLTQLRAAG